MGSNPGMRVQAALSGGNAEARRAFQTLAASYLEGHTAVPKGPAKAVSAGRRRRLFTRRRKES